MPTRQENGHDGYTQPQAASAQRQVRGPARRFSDMGHERDRIAAYFSRLVTGLVACGLLATTLGARIAAVVIIAGVMLSVLAITCLLLRNGDL
jgi:hypothetical protein